MSPFRRDSRIAIVARNDQGWALVSTRNGETLWLLVPPYRKSNKTARTITKLDAETWISSGIFERISPCDMCEFDSLPEVVRYISGGNLEFVTEVRQEESKHLLRKAPAKWINFLSDELHRKWQARIKDKSKFSHIGEHDPTDDPALLKGTLDGLHFLMQLEQLDSNKKRKLSKLTKQIEGFLKRRYNVF